MRNTPLKTTLLYSLLILACLFSVGPFLWLLSTALKSNAENIFAYPPQWIPNHPTLDHFVKVWDLVPLAGYFINSFVVTGLAVGLTLITSTLAAYPLARMDFKGKNTIFLTILATMMVPFQVLIIPLYLLVNQLHLTDHSSAWAAYLGLALPFVVSGFGIFFMRQAFIAIPKQLEEAATLDGCTHWQTLVHVMLPLVKPSLATLAIFTFMANWGEFLWPNVILSKPDLYTLPLGLVYLQGAFSANWRLIAAATILSTIPIVLFYLLLQRYFVSNAASSGVKG